jgi:triosephosphate isomerase
MRRKLAAGNWKMNGTAESLSEIKNLEDAAKGRAEVVICPPATLIGAASTAATRVAIGAQDCHTAQSGAHTGDLSAQMLAASGARYIITGHSERRADHGETDTHVRNKTLAAWEVGCVAILCIGETLDQREAGQTLDVLAEQLAGSVPDGVTGDQLVIAYEPVWAIGTGKVPTTDQIGEVHEFIRKKLEDRFTTAVADSVRLLYGGSVKASNATEIFAVGDVDGALVGGASLKAADFGPIVAALNAAS